MSPNNWASFAFKFEKFQKSPSMVTLVDVHQKASFDVETKT